MGLRVFELMEALEDSTRAGGSSLKATSNRYKRDLESAGFANGYIEALLCVV